MRARSTHPRVTRPLCELLSLVTMLLLASVARADAGRVAVLTLVSDDVDESLTTQLSDALRQAVRDDGTYQLSDAKVSLDQLSMAQDCDASSESCLVDIAQGLGVDGLIYGSLASKGGRGASVEVHFFDTRGKSAPTQADSIFATQAPPNAELVAKAASLVARLFGKEAPEAAEPTPSGPVAADVSSEPAAEQMASQQASAPEAMEGSSSGISTRRVVGYSLLGVAAVSVGLTALSFIQIDRAEGNEDFVTYATAVGDMKPSVENVCDEIDANVTYGVSDKVFAGARSKCSAGNTYQLLQFVFIGAAVVSGGLSAYLLLGEDDPPGEHARAGRSSLAFEPLLTRKSQGFSARLRF